MSKRIMIRIYLRTKQLLLENKGLTKKYKGIPILEISDEAEKLASVFVEYGPISETHSEDALHIALAISNGMDFLVTWNFHHINNAILKKEISKISEENGYECPMICSPEEVEGA